MLRPIGRVLTKHTLRNETLGLDAPTPEYHVYRFSIAERIREALPKFSVRERTLDFSFSSLPGDVDSVEVEGECCHRVDQAIYSYLNVGVHRTDRVIDPDIVRVS